MSKGKVTGTPPGHRSSHPSVSGGDPGQATQEVLRIDGPGLSVQNEAASGAIVINLDGDQDVTTQFLCKVPVSIDVSYCRCGGILSQRFNDSLFCRSCGQEGTH